MAKYVCNAMSLQMVDGYSGCFQWARISEDMFKMLSANAESYMGHKDLAKYTGVPYNRANLKLHDGDILYVAQLWNGRLPVGSTEIPDDLEIRYFMVNVIGGE